MALSQYYFVLQKCYLKKNICFTVLNKEGGGGSGEHARRYDPDHRFNVFCGLSYGINLLCTCSQVFRVENLGQELLLGWSNERISPTPSLKAGLFMRYILIQPCL